jgi:hypothetical protein
MEPQEAVAFGLALDSLAEVFGTQLSTARKMAYWDALEELTLDEVKAACAKAIRSESFFPVPATLLRLAGHGVEEIVPQADAAWIALRNKQQRYNRESLADPIIREVFEAMGGGYVLEWGFGNWPAEKEEQKRREFLSRYREVQHARTIAAGQRHETSLLTDGA